MLTQEEMNILVPEKLKQIEEEYHIEILYCAESGSRAWGLSSKDSDYDVRFIYKRKASDYLKLNKVRDTIELPIDDTWDVVGFDLDKTLLLINKSNPTLYEWLSSPIIYFNNGFKERIQKVLNDCFLENKMLYHYLSTAKANFKTYFNEEIVKIKKYFYVLRPLLCCKWIIKYHQNPPMLFDTLKDEFLSGDELIKVNQLLEYKRTSNEVDTIKQIDCLTTYINNTVNEIDTYLKNLEYHKDNFFDIINEFFLSELDIK